MSSRKLDCIKELLVPKKEVVAVYLFGSRAKGLSSENSDIDIGVLLDKKYKPGPLYESELSLEIEQFLNSEKRFDVRILNNKGITFLHQVLRDGKLLFSGNERKRIRFESNVYRDYLDFKPFLIQFNKLRRKRLLA